MNVEALFKQYYPRLRNYAVRFTGSRFAGEDIVQECFIKLYERRFTLKEVSPGALLFVMVRNSCINYTRFRQLTESGNAVQSAVAHTPEDDLMLMELRSEIDRVMESLPPKCREIFRMSRIDGMNTREIADYTGTSTQNIEKHIARAKDIFARHFAGLDISGSGIL